MKILLINDNPVVNKLVTLSAQKTSDDLEVVSSLDDIASQKYDLVVIDDTLYSDDLLVDLNTKISYKRSLYICSRDAQEVESFTQTLKKPFLPTDLVELFALLGKEIASEPEIDESSQKSSDAEIEDFDEISLDDTLDDISEDDAELADFSLEDDIDLEDSLELDDIEEESLGESVLDDAEAQKVKELLDETEEELDLDEELSLDEELDDLDSGDDLEDDAFEFDDLSLEEESAVSEEVDDLNLDDFDVDDVSDEAVSMEEELDGLDLDNPSEEEGAEDEDKENDVDEDLDAFDDEEEIDVEDELNLEEIPTEALESEVDSATDVMDDLTLDEDLDLESQIEQAVTELSDADLESEVDEETLMDIVSGVDSIEGLSSRDLKLALGEEVSEEELEQEKSAEEFEETPLESVVDSEEGSETLTTESENSGVAALKNLLQALSDKNVAASMKGMKITINITLGDE